MRYSCPQAHCPCAAASAGAELRLDAPAHAAARCGRRLAPLAVAAGRRLHGGQPAARPIAAHRRVLRGGLRAARARAPGARRLRRGVPVRPCPCARRCAWAGRLPAACQLPLVVDLYAHHKTGPQRASKHSQRPLRAERAFLRTSARGRAAALGSACKGALAGSLWHLGRPAPGPERQMVRGLGSIPQLRPCTPWHAQVQRCGGARRRAVRGEGRLLGL